MVLAVILAFTAGLATSALGAVPGDPFKLGRLNAVNAVTHLAGKSTGAMLRLDNNSSAENSRALSLEVQPGKAPLSVNASTGKATNLDADRVGGQNASAFYSGETYNVSNSRAGSGNGSPWRPSGRRCACRPGSPTPGGTPGRRRTSSSSCGDPWRRWSASIW